MSNTPPPDHRLGVVVKRLREAKGLTQEDLAYSAGVTVGTVSKTETGETNPSWFTIQRLAAALGVSLVELVRALEGEEG